MEFAGEASAFQGPSSQSQTPQQVHVVHRRADLAYQFLQKTQLLCDLDRQRGLQEENPSPPLLSEDKGNHHEMVELMLLREPTEKCRRRVGKFLPAMVKAQQRIADVPGMAVAPGVGGLCRIVEQVCLAIGRGRVKPA